MIGWLKNKVVKKKLRESQVLLHWKDIDGHKIYYFKEVNMMPTFRYLAIRLGLEKMGLGLRPVDIKKFVETMRDDLVKYIQFSEGDENEVPRNGYVQRLFTLLDHYEFMADNFASERLIAEIGGMGVVVDDEPLEVFSEKHSRLKESLLAENSELYDFFLSNMIGYYSQLKPGSKKLREQDFLNPQLRERERAFLNLMRVPIYTGLWQDTMRRLFGSQKS